MVRWSGGQYGIYSSHKVTGGAELTRIFAIFHENHTFIGILALLKEILLKLLLFLFKEILYCTHPIPHFISIAFQSLRHSSFGITT